MRGSGNFRRRRGAAGSRYPRAWGKGPNSALAAALAPFFGIGIAFFVVESVDDDLSGHDVQVVTQAHGIALLHGIGDLFEIKVFEIQHAVSLLREGVECFIQPCPSARFAQGLYRRIGGAVHF